MILPNCDLPVLEVLPALRRSLAAGNRAVLSAPPGSGKTTGVPPALLDAAWLEGRRILMLEPRRLAARAAARRMAAMLGCEVGQTVGYRTRFDNKTSSDTRIEVVTEGILTRMLQRDPELPDVGLVVFDEFHERSLQADLGMALTLDVQSNLREDLRLLVMSATLQTERICALLDGAPLIQGGGRSYPVTLRYLEKGAICRNRLVERVVLAVGSALREESVDVLVFLPGTAEIRQVTAALSALASQGIRVCPLYGDLPRDAQDRAIRGDAEGHRRVVLVTSIAESSLTIEGIGAVVDSGLARRPRFDPNTGLTRLQTFPVSQAEADQRAGRAGRLGPGLCYRLWSEAEHTRLAAAPVAEIREADLAPLLLELANWGVKDPAELHWLDRPAKGACSQALSLLQGLGALDYEGRITTGGRRILELPMHPRLAHMVVQGIAFGATQQACDLAALLGERDILRREAGARPSADIEHRLKLLTAWREEGAAMARRASVDLAACRRIDALSRQWQRRYGRQDSTIRTSIPGGGALLALAFPDRVAKRRTHDTHVYQLANGRAARLPEGDPLSGAEYLVCAQLDAGRREGRIFAAAEIALEDIEAMLAGRIETKARVRWNDRTGGVEATRERCLDRVVLNCQPLQETGSGAIVSALLEGIRRRGLGVLPWNEASRQWGARLMCLRQWQPETGWPPADDDSLLRTLETWLAPWLEGMTRIEHLRRLDMSQVLAAMLDWPQQQRMDELAPTHLRVPSGSRKPLHYAPDAAPILAVRLQELFGLRETPTVCRGRVSVLLHILSPAQRPIQVTQDLEGFWTTTYQEVKRQLKGRYPKHYWPDDPWEAIPTARVRPRNYP